MHSSTAPESELQMLRCELKAVRQELRDRDEEYETLAEAYRSSQRTSASLISRLADTLERRLAFHGPWKEEALLSEARAAVRGAVQRPPGCASG
jgi:hypothetical protein